MNILGISCHYHDAAACLLREGEIVTAAQEERFNRNKNSSDFPTQAIHYCIQEGNIGFSDIDCVAFYEKPFLKFYRTVVDHIHAYPFSLERFLNTMPAWLQDRLALPLMLKKEFGFEREVRFVKHHLSHAASSFFPSPFAEAAILTADAVGEWTTTTCGVGRGNQIKILREIKYPHSLGLLYTTVTTYLGFAALRGEGKVMGLAAYGKPCYTDTFRNMVRAKDDGSFRLDLRYFNFVRGTKMYGKKFTEVFGPERLPEDAITERHCDIAASLQVFLEETMIKIIRNLYEEIKIDSLCLSGGIFLNCVLNGKILEQTPFKKVFIQPAAGDSGGAVGAASYLYYNLFGGRRKHIMNHAYLGPRYSSRQIRRVLSSHDIAFREMEKTTREEYVARLLVKNKIVGWFQGRMEFGPRALGNRSILANPCHPHMKRLLNEKVKKREPFRPYAPAVLEEKATDYFAIQQNSPFMLLTASVLSEKRPVIPAVTHVDGTARVQTVSRGTSPRFWGLIDAFFRLSGVPLVLNTSFNLRDEPIVCTPDDAVRCFQESGMDCMVLEDYIIEKTSCG